MTDHRKLQRTLFRMQADEAFARAILQGDDRAVRSTALDRNDLALLTGLDPAALSADPGGRRRTQIAGNAASEFTLSLALAAREPFGASFLDAFLGSDEFHQALADDGRLPLAFGAYALRRAHDESAPGLAAVAALELAMATLRRTAAERPQRPALAAGAVRLGPLATVERLPAGTADAAAELRAALDADRTSPAVEVGGADEHVLLVAAPPATPHRLTDVRVERLLPPVDALLVAAREPLDGAARAAFARAHGAAPEDLERFLAGYLVEGVLERGPDPVPKA